MTQMFVPGPVDMVLPKAGYYRDCSLLTALLLTRGVCIANGRGKKKDLDLCK